jgi:O-antigen ligase
LQKRIEIWRRAVASATKRPVLGKGPGTFELREPGTAVAPLSSHNVFVEVLVEMGVLGLAAYVWLLGAVLLTLHRARRRAPPDVRIAGFALEAAILGYLTASLALSSPFQSPLFTLLGLSLAFARVARAASDDRSTMTD